MVMKVDCAVEQSLVITITQDDNTSKTQVVSIGDTVAVDYNKNGDKKHSTGIVSAIHADPYNAKCNRKDWYMTVSADSEFGGYVKIPVFSILNLEVLHQKRPVNPINTPNDKSRVTDIRCKGGILQISQNNGRSWLNVLYKLIPDDPSDSRSIRKKILDMIGSDQYSNSDEFIDGIIALIHQEIARILGGDIKPYEIDDRVKPGHCPYADSTDDEYGN